MADLAYLLSALLAVAFYIGAAWLLWQLAELGYFIFCKLTRRDY